jgi:membrane protease YdiL (CAAX protease family)
MLMVEGTYAIYGMVAGEAASAERHEMLVKLSEEQVVRFRQVSPAIIALCFSLLPAFCEEWFFRGMLLRSLSREWKPWAAIFTTAMLFGVFHILSNSAISLDRFLPTMLIGILLGYIAWKSNSILPGFILHALHNGTVAFLGYYQPQLSKLDWFPQEAEKIPPSWGIVGCILAAIGVAIVARAKRSQPQ